MTIALALSALAVVGGLTAFGFYLARMLKAATDDAKGAHAGWRVEVELRGAAMKERDDLRRLNEEAQKALTSKEEELKREVAARKSIEAHAQKLLAELAKSGNPSAVAAQVRKELAELAALSTTK